jgi:hypothetical protein
VACAEKVGGIGTTVKLTDWGGSTVPSGIVAVTVTWYVPGADHVWLAVVPLAWPPSPKVHCAVAGCGSFAFFTRKVTAVPTFPCGWDIVMLSETGCWVVDVGSGVGEEGGEVDGGEVTGGDVEGAVEG